MRDGTIDRAITTIVTAVPPSLERRHSAKPNGGYFNFKQALRACVADPLSTSLPGLTRQSILMRRGWTRGSSPRVTDEGGSTSSGRDLGQRAACPQRTQSIE